MDIIINKIESYKSEFESWFKHLHQNPELSMKESQTASYIADLLKQWGYEVTSEVGKHGIVASLTTGSGTKSIGLRADFDALPIQEVNELPYKSNKEGIAHLCGHDGHTTMLLIAAKYLAETKKFNGTVRLIFQPGEETMED